METSATPSDKEKKYDRQLRLWAASGQQALEDAHILLLNSGSGTAGVETLKNLVLPGIGKFTIYDNNAVSNADLGVNFFLDEESLRKSRAETCVKLLQELNPDVRGDWFPKLETDTINKVLEEINKYTLIIYTSPVDTDTQMLVRQYGEKNRVPLVFLQSAGFYSYFRIELPANFPIVDTHPEPTATTDLRLLTPWPELSKFALDLTRHIDELNDHEHGHIPYLVLLLYYLNKWKESHGGYPKSYSEKKKFRGFVAAGARTSSAEGAEENFDEAAAAVLKTVSPQTLESSVKEVLDYKPDIDEAKSNFWVIVDAVKKFYAKHGELPLPGSVPDMKTKSTVYVQLQNIYKAKAREDVAEVLESVRRHPHGKDVDVTEVEAFCKNAAFIKLIHKTNSSSEVANIAKKEFESDEHSAAFGQPLSLLPIYLALKATTSTPNATAPQILATIDQEVPGASSDESVVNAAKEVARAQGGELHSISALTGGMVSQEVIKIITKQYVPIDNICVFDGITSRTQIFRI